MAYFVGVFGGEVPKYGERPLRHERGPRRAAADERLEVSAEVAQIGQVGRKVVP